MIKGAITYILNPAALQRKEFAVENEKLRARIEDLEALLKDCADDLEAEIEARYGQSKSHQPLKYACDMVPVIAARAALNGES